MVVRIRLARMGRVKFPRYNIAVSYVARGPTRKPIEVLGTYDPVPKKLGDGLEPIKEVHLDFERAQYWLGVGAQPSDTVRRMFEKFGLLPEKPITYTPATRGEKTKNQ